MKPLLLVVLASATPLVVAQLAGSAVPNAGSILQQIQPPLLTAPPSDLGLTIQQADKAKFSGGVPFLVTSIQITGNKKIPTETLHALVKDGEGKNLTLAQLEELSDRITDYYRSHGYPLARAIIPAQSIQNGIVMMQVIVARYGKIALNNSSRINDLLLTNTLAPLVKGQDIEQAGLDRALLLMSDLPGLAVNSTLMPGAEVGTSDLLVSTTPTKSIFGSINVDNYGSTYTGRPRIGGTVNFVDPLNLKSSDTLSLTGLTSGAGVNFVRAAYESVLNGNGTVAGASLSALRYKLGSSLAAINAHGAAQIRSLWVRQPLVRSRDVNFYGQLQYDNVLLRDRIDATSIRTDRHLNNVTLSLTGDARDDIMSGGINTWNFGVTSGRVDFDDIEAQSSNAATAKTRGPFSKWSTSFNRQQGLSMNSSVYLGFTGQWANTNLDPSQKMSVGGPYSVRAYNIGALSGDVGYFVTGEYRYGLGQAWDGQWQATAFVDSARITINKTTWTAGENSATLSGAGLGLNWTGPDQWSARAYIAKPIGSVPILLNTPKSTRVWVETRKGF